MQYISQMRISEIDLSEHSEESVIIISGCIYYYHYFHRIITTRSSKCYLDH